MQFFTDENCASRVAHEEYEAYWKQHASELPNALLLLNAGMRPQHWFTDHAEAICLHDSRIRNAGRIGDDWRVVFEGGYDNPRRVTVCYRAVSTVPHIPLVLSSDAGPADLMCHETTLGVDRRFRHAMLFASGDEVIVEFDDIVVDSEAFGTNRSVD